MTFWDISGMKYETIIVTWINDSRRDDPTYRSDIAPFDSHPLSFHTHDSRGHYMYDRARKMTISTTKQSIYRSSRSSLNKMPFVRTSNSKIGPGTFPFHFERIIALYEGKNRDLRKYLCRWKNYL